jgi:putative peptidoglycan lipid II flippase
MSARALAVRMLRPVDLDAPAGTSLTRGSMLSTTGLLAQGVLRFATAFLVGHVAGRAELGLVASAIATATLLALLWPTTTGSAASKFIARARGAGRDDEVHSIAAHLSRRTAQTGILLGLASAVVWVLIDHGTWLEAASVAALTVAYSGYSFTRGVQFGARQVPRATSWDLASVVAGLLALAALLTLGVRGPALILPLVLAYGLYTLAGWPHGARGRPSPGLRRELDGFVALGAAGSLASTGFLQLSQITAKVSTGDADAGQYAAALNLATPASMLAASLSLVLFPSMAQAWGRGDHASFHEQTDRATRALAMVMVAIFGSLILCSRLAVDVIWGSRFQGAQDVLPILVLAVLASNLAVPSVNALTTRSQRGMWVTTGASLGGMAVGAVVWWMLAGPLGTVGVAVGYLCGTLVIASIPVAITWWSARHAWAGVFGRVAVALLVVGGLSWLQRGVGLSRWTDPLVAVVFLGTWLLLARQDLHLLPLRRFGRRR